MPDRMLLAACTVCGTATVDAGLLHAGMSAGGSIAANSFRQDTQANSPCSFDPRSVCWPQNSQVFNGSSYATTLKHLTDGLWCWYRSEVCVVRLAGTVSLD
jgi:hypothetical protein